MRVHVILGKLNLKVSEPPRHPLFSTSTQITDTVYENESSGPTSVREQLEQHHQKRITVTMPALEVGSTGVVEDVIQHTDCSTFLSQLRSDRRWRLSSHTSRAHAQTHTHISTPHLHNRSRATANPADSTCCIVPSEFSPEHQQLSLTGLTGRGLRGTFCLRFVTIGLGS